MRFDPSKTRLTLALLTLSCLTDASSAQELLPAGVGIFTGGYRYQPQLTEKFDESGNIQPLGSEYSSEFDGASLSAGRGGTELKKMVDELKRYDQGNGNQALYQRINLGRLELKATADVRTMFMGGGFGFTKSITGYFAIPWISASVDSTLAFSGKNNASEINQELGELAFKELRDGLNQAANLSQTQIDDSFNDAGYQSLGHWEHTGVGDILLGVRSRKRIFGNRFKRIGYMIGQAEVSLPTGYVEDADILNDISFGEEVATLSLSGTQYFKFSRFLKPFIGGSYKHRFSADKNVRLPETSETLVDSSRKYQLQFSPGNEAEFHGGLKSRFSRIISADYRLSASNKNKDQYSGDHTGNYETLAINSEKKEIKQKFSLFASTVSQYRRKKIAVPLIVELGYHNTLAMTNGVNSPFFEIRLSSFFGTKRKK